MPDGRLEAEARRSATPFGGAQPRESGSAGRYREHAAGELTDHLTGFVPKPYSARELAAAFAALLASPVPDVRLSDEAEALPARAALG